MNQRGSLMKYEDCLAFHLNAEDIKGELKRRAPEHAHTIDELRMVLSKE
jgi:hypothetical protein